MKGDITRCELCATPFVQKYSHRHTKYCTVKCSHIGIGRSRIKEWSCKGDLTNCIRCGSPFLQKYSWRATKYCSRVCAELGSGEVRRKSTYLPCSICGKHRPPRKTYCSLDCYKKAVAKTPEQQLEATEARKEKSRIKYREWYWSGQGYEYEMRRRFTVEVQAGRSVQRAVAAGKLEKPERCSDCGQLVSDQSKLQGHHTDYSKPLEVQWLCGPCHGKRHQSHAS